MKNIHTTEGEAVKMFDAHNLTQVKNPNGQVSSEEDTEGWKKRWTNSPRPCTIAIDGECLCIIGRGHI